MSICRKILRTSKGDQEMICPKCKSTNVHEMRFQSPEGQVICETCNTIGTYYQFGLDKVLNVGLATSYDGAKMHAEQEMFDASDGTYSIAVTVHEVDEVCACNFWVRIYGQWLKFIPERTLEYEASEHMLAGEVLRFGQSEKFSSVMHDLRWRLAIQALHSITLEMID